MQFITNRGNLLALRGTAMRLASDRNGKSTEPVLINGSTGKRKGSSDTNPESVYGYIQ